ncbi:MAG: hypothetical protein ABW019_12415 [Chitinophagaceae bacterium]
MRKIIGLAGLFLIGTIARAQLLRIHEQDPDNKSYSNIRYADINSTIRLELDTAALYARISKAGLQPYPSDVSTLLSILVQALAKKNEMLEEFDAAIRSHRTTIDPQAAAAEAARFNARIRKIAGEIVALFDADPVLELYYAEETDLRLIAPLYPALERRIRDLERDLATADAAAVRIRLGGWLVHKGQPVPLHFTGLDSLPRGEFYELDRWRFLPTEAQLEELEKLQQLARTSALKEASLKELLVDTYLKEFGNLLRQSLETAAASFEEEARRLVDNSAAGPLKATLEQLLADGDRLETLLKERIAYYGSIRSNTAFTLAGLLAGVRTDLTTIGALQKNIVASVKRLKTEVAAAGAAVQDLSRELLALAEQKLTTAAASFLEASSLDRLAATARIDVLALSFSDKVLALSIKELPADMSTDLRYAGQREVGDRVEVKLVVTGGADQRQLLQEMAGIALYRIAPHLEGTVGVIFAHPLRTTQVKKDFQMAPYYNLLFKGMLGMSGRWKRRSALPNTLLDLSFGLHVSSPDFNKDDVPELGVGLVASTLRDYLQFGWAYNVFEGGPYLFFGLRLPVPSMNFGGNGNGAGAIDR